MKYKTPDEINAMNEGRFKRGLSPIKGLDCWMWVHSHFTRTRKTVADLRIPYLWIRDKNNKEKKVYARRFAWELYNGTLKPGQIIVNMCGEDLCVKPEPPHNVVQFSGRPR